ncbi:MAG TPA: hypothetical protein DEA08_38095 [Planctomycetes bacterium]|nr:hypothetical protein [Planctomycetota bacterium]
MIVDVLASEAKRDLTAVWRLLDEAARSYPEAAAVRRVRLALLARHLPQAFLTAGAQAGEEEAELAVILAPAALERRFDYLLDDAYGGTAAEHQRDLERLEGAVERWSSLPRARVAGAKTRALEAHARDWSAVAGLLLRARLGRLERVLRSAPASQGAGGSLLVPALSRAMAQRLTAMWSAIRGGPSAEELDDLCELERVLGVLDGGRRSSERFQNALAQVMLDRTISGSATAAQLHGFARHGLPGTDPREVARRHPDALAALERRSPACDCAKVLRALIVPRDYATLTQLGLDPDAMRDLSPLYLAEVLYMALEHVPEGAEQVETARRLAKRIQGIELPLLLRRWHHEARWHVARVEGQQLSISASERSYTDQLRAAARKDPQDRQVRRVLVEWLKHSCKILPPAQSRPLLEEALSYADRPDDREAIRALLAKLKE